MPETPNLAAVLARRFTLSTTVPDTFFQREAAKIADACWAMARRFHQGGRLLAFGNGAWATDAQHVSVEFVHPVIMGKRALPALALTNDSATLSAFSHTFPERAFARQIQILSRPQDIALGFSFDGREPDILAALNEASQHSLLTLGLCGCTGGAMLDSSLNFCFVVPSDDPFVIQETHESLYHVLWELVHIFFEHEGLLS